MKKRGITPLKSLIEEIGGWPVILDELWNEEVLTWEEVIYEAFKRGLTVEFPFKFATARINSTNSTHFREVYAVLKIINLNLKVLKIFFVIRFFNHRCQFLMSAIIN